MPDCYNPVRVLSVLMIFLIIIDFANILEYHYI